MTIEEKRRELFEAWQGENADKERYRRGPCAGMYKNPVMQNRWKGFNDALDAVVIQLPIAEHYTDDKAYSAVADCRAAIESTGLGLKVKS